MSAERPAVPSGTSAAGLGWPLIFALIAIAAVLIGWTGYISSDDAAYYHGAARWLSNPPYAGDDHWSTRFPVVLSFAAMLAIFGKGFVAFGVTALLWYAALVALVGRFAARLGGRDAGWIAAILVVTLPVINGNASTVGCDLAEALFLMAGAWGLTARDGEAISDRRALIAGICFSLAILCRETALLALAGLGPLFLIGRPVSRRALVLAGVGAAVVLLGEMAFQAIMTGDPLHRYLLAFNHDDKMDRAANLEGNLLIHPAIDPLLVLLINNDFALLFWLAAAAVAIRRPSRAELNRLAVPLAMGLAVFVLVGALTTKLVLNPRYFTMTALAAVLLVSPWLASLSPRWRAFLLIGMVGLNLLMLSAQDAHPRWPAEALVLAAEAHREEPVLTDHETRHRADQPLDFAGLANARADKPTPGQLFLASEEDAVSGPILATYPAPPTVLGRFIEALGLANWLPEPIARRLLHPSPTMMLRRVGT
jgi:4-amino-4-deoxy-L-arabinose transferase-like glycosyltransferase